MSKVINSMLSGGGGFSVTDAVLRVIAPTGSTVTLTRSSATKTAQGISLISGSNQSCYYFTIGSSEYSATAWTVTATSGNDSASATVVINAAGEYGVILTYWDGVLYDAGDEYTSITGGFETFCPAFSSTPTGATKNAGNLKVFDENVAADTWPNAAFGTVNEIDLSGFTTLHVQATAASSSAPQSNPHFHACGVMQGSKYAQFNDGNLVSSATEPNMSLSVGENTLDITSLSSGYVWIGGSCRNGSGVTGGGYNVVVTKIWLT